MLDEHLGKKFATHELRDSSCFLLPDGDLSGAHKRRLDQHRWQHAAMILQQSIAIHFGNRPTSHYSCANHSVYSTTAAPDPHIGPYANTCPGVDGVPSTPINQAKALNP